MRKDEGKKGSESRCDEREVKNRDDDGMKSGRKKRNRESGREKGQHPGRCKTEELL